MVKKRYLRDVTLQFCNFKMAKLDVFDLFSQSIHLFFKLHVYIPKLSEKCTFMNNYQIWRTGMSRKDLSHTLHFAK